MEVASCALYIYILVCCIFKHCIYISTGKNMLLVTIVAMYGKYGICIHKHVLLPSIVILVCTMVALKSAPNHNIVLCSLAHSRSKPDLLPIFLSLLLPGWLIHHEVVMPPLFWWCLKKREKKCGLA